MTHRDGLPRFSALSVRCGDAGHREACATPSESLGKPPLRSRRRPGGGRRKVLTMHRIACNFPPARRAAYAISMSHDQRSLVLTSTPDRGAIPWCQKRGTDSTPPWGDNRKRETWALNKVQTHGPRQLAAAVGPGSRYLPIGRVQITEGTLAGSPTHRAPFLKSPIWTVGSRFRSIRKSVTVFGAWEESSGKSRL